MNEPESFELNRLSVDGVDDAIKRAEHYRLLNDPEQAESICLDVLLVEPQDQRNLVVLILAITDQFSAQHAHATVARALELVSQLGDEYQRAYYAGIVHEREARACLDRGPASMFAYNGYRTAMDFYERAEGLRPLKNDDAILRWNSCVRAIRRARLHPVADDEQELPLE
jgi:hypothetical protein